MGQLWTDADVLPRPFTAATPVRIRLGTPKLPTTYDNRRQLVSRLCPVRTGRPRSFAREGVNLETSTLFGWVGATAAVLKPLLDTLAAEVMASAPRWSAASTCY